MRLTQDHKPTDPKEEERIKKAGGVITQPSLGRPRVNSKLDMSRSIGDVELKAFGVTCEPDTRHIQVRKHFQASHSDWKTWKNGKAFSSLGKVRKVREFQTNVIYYF